MACLSTVQFRGLSSHYKPGHPIKASFRYAVESGFKACIGDRIGVLPENAKVVEEALLSVETENPSEHHLCDGGLYRTSSVTINCLGNATGRCELWYISHQGVLGKSEAFTVCVSDSDYPSISFGSMDDQTIMKSVRTLATSYVDAGEMLMSGPSTLGSSFVLVSEGSSCEVPGSDYVMAQAEGCLSKQGSDVTCNQTDDVTCGSGDDSRGNATKIKEGMERAREDGVHSSEAALTISYVVCSSGPIAESPPITALDNSQSESESSSKSLLSHDPQKAESSLPSERSLKTEAEESHGISKPSSLASSYSDLSAVLASPLGPEVTDMSSSTVIIEKHMTQREARMLKTANKDLRVKVHKLSEILEEKKGLVDSLTGTLTENESRLLQMEEHMRSLEEEREKSENTAASFKHQLLKSNQREKELQRQLLVIQNQVQRNENSRRKTEGLNKKLMIENSTLEGRVKQLSQENKTIFERSSKLLTQLQDSETKREIERSEKNVLQVKIDYLVTELKKLKHDSQIVEQKAHSSRSKRAENVPPSSSELPPTIGSTRRPPDLQLGTGSVLTHREEMSKPKQRLLPKYNAGDAQQRASNGHQQFVAKLEEEEVVSKYGSQGAGGRNTRQPKEGESRQRNADHPMTGGALASQLEPAGGGSGSVRVVDCPICGKWLHARENDYGIMLHVEHCIQLSELAKK